MISKPSAPLSELYLFVVYDNPADYTAKTGKPCPVFDPTKSTKRWSRPMLPGEKAARYVGPFNILAINEANGDALLNEEGKPYTEPVGFTAEAASAVNIPTPGFGSGAPLAEILCPVRDLAPEEELFIPMHLAASGAAVMVKNKTLYQEVPTETDTMGLLQQINSKLDILIQRKGA